MEATARQIDFLIGDPSDSLGRDRVDVKGENRDSPPFIKARDEPLHVTGPQQHLRMQRTGRVAAVNALELLQHQRLPGLLVDFEALPFGLLEILDNID